MSDLTSASTLTEVWASYDNNASYAEDRSITKARAFVTACRILLRRTPSNSVKGSNQIGMRVDLVEKELERAQAWLEARSLEDQIQPKVVRPDFRNFRG